MTQILRQSTAVDVLIGPFVDVTDGATSEEGETPVVLLSKNGQALGAKSDATTPTHDDAGYYNCELDTTDTNTVGTLILVVEKSVSALPVRHEFQVMEEATYDLLYAANATGAGGIADAVWDEAYESTETARQLLRGIRAILFGTASGLTGPTATFRDRADSKNRVTATIDGSARTVTSTDLT